ncbi:MAG: DUF2945 domain-containing protein [Caldimonas sp.]
MAALGRAAGRRRRARHARLATRACAEKLGSVPGHTHHASNAEPQYEIESDKTNHVAMHKGSVLKKSR